MIKMINCIRRKKKFRRDEFLSHWLEYHAPFAPSEPAIASYTQLHGLENNIPRDHMPQALKCDQPPFDGFAIVTYADFDAFEASMRNSPVIKAGIADDSVFIDSDRSVACITREHVLLEPRTCFPTMNVSVLNPPAYVLVECLRRKSTLSREAFQEAWLEHGQRVLNYRDKSVDLGLMGYLQNHTFPGEKGGVDAFAGEEPFDGIGMSFFGSIIFFREFVGQSLAAPPMVRSEEEFVDHSRSRYVLTRRFRLLDPCR